MLDRYNKLPADKKRKRRIFNWKNAFMVYALPNVLAFFATIFWLFSRKTIEFSQ